MAQRVIIVHRLAGTPGSDWYPWLRKQLEDAKVRVIVPAMPDTAKPVIDRWVEALRREAGKLDELTYLVGHSIGCQTILRFLEKYPSLGSPAGVLLVAPWLTLASENIGPEEKHTTAPWISTPIDLNSLKKRSKYVIHFSDDDPYVPLDENKKMFNPLGARIIVDHNLGHYDEDTGMREVPGVLKTLKALMR